MRVGLVQMCSGLSIARNLADAGGLIAAARDAGAELVVTPEMTTIVAPRREVTLEALGAEGDGGATAAFASLAERHRVHLLVGSMAVRRADGRLANRSLLFAPDGGLIASYDKVHMFDVDLPGGETYRESRSYASGDRLVAVAAAGARVGMSVCYDVRFPALYRRLAQAGADVLTVPSAFTVATGEAHWHVLLRARAIETGCFVLAPAQTGRHESGRTTYGHSLVVSPWGEILADAGVDPGVITADIDLDEVARARRRIPALVHDRTFNLLQTGDQLESALP